MDFSLINIGKFLMGRQNPSISFTIYTGSIFFKVHGAFVYTSYGFL